MIHELERFWSFLETDVFKNTSEEISRQSGHLLFNPYNKEKSEDDLEDAWRIRQNNLLGYFRSFREVPRVCALVVGEAPGHRGVRFSGVPFTSEKQLCCDEFFRQFHGHRSSTDKQLNFSRTSEVFWDVMRGYHPKFIAWNCMPYHPYKAVDLPRSNRTPRSGDLKIGSRILGQLWACLQKPLQVIAVGSIAKKALEMAGIQAILVRHPAARREYRGMFKPEMVRKMKAICE
jgi:uracil-DNA glycosylase